MPSCVSPTSVDSGSWVTCHGSTRPSPRQEEDHSICDGVADEVEGGATAADEQHCQGLVAVKEPEMPASDIAIEVLALVN